MKRPFDAEKATEAIVYVASKMPRNNATFYIILKLLYLADKLHLERYGRLITGEQYVAMKNGPAPSGAYDIVKDVRGDGYYCFGDHPKHSFSVEQTHHINPLRAPELDLLSESEIEVFDEVIAKHGDWSFGRLRAITHDAAWENADENEMIHLVDICMTLPNGDLLVEHLSDPYPN